MQYFRGTPKGGKDPIVLLLKLELCNGSWPGQMWSCDHQEITLLRNRWVTLSVYSSVTYIVCVLDSEGQWIGLESLLTVEQLFSFCAHEELSVHGSSFFFFSKCKTCTFLVAEEQRSGLAVTALLQCLVLRGEIKEGERPPRQTLQNAPLSFTSQPNLNLTMEPAQYACNPIHGPGRADLPE